MAKRATILIIVSFILTASIVIRSELNSDSNDSTKQSGPFDIINGILSRFTTATTTTISIKNYCPGIDYSKNITAIGKSYIRLQLMDNATEFILQMMQTDTLSIIKNIAGIIKAMPGTSYFCLGYLFVFITLLISSVFICCCNFCGCCCYCCLKGQPASNNCNKLCYANLVLSMCILAVMAFLGSGFSTKLPYGVNSVTCTVALSVDDILNGVDETYMVVDEKPAWIGIN